MKKIIFLAISVLALLAGSTAVHAQGYYPPPRRYPRPRKAPQQAQRQNTSDFNKPRFGVVGGLNFANVIDPSNSSFNTNTRIGINAGVSLDVPVVYPIGFEVELLYSGKGYTANSGYGQFTQRSNFIDLPLLAKFRVTPGFSFVVGPQVSFLLSTQNIYTSGFTNTVVQQQYSQDAQGYNKAVIDGVIGVAINLNKDVELRGRYTIDLQSNTAYQAGYNPQYNNQAFQLGLAFKF